MCHWYFYHLFVLHNNETTTRDKAFFYSKSFQHNAKAGLCPAFARFGEHEKSRLTWSIILNEAIPLVVMRNKELRLVQENHVTAKPASSSSCSSVAPRGTKTYSESRIELRNLQILKKMLEKQTVFVIRKAQWDEMLGRCLEYCRSWKIRSANLRLQSTLEIIQFEFFEWKER